MSFSSFDRSKHLNVLQNEEFDLLIIGGGITGCGIALDAATRGLKTALIEKNDFAYGTSSRSTKLIHGGLRYLKQLEFGLVKEVGSERAIVHRLAPHLVIPEKMLLPLTEKSLGATLTSIGLKIYDWLAGVKREDRRKMLTRFQTLKQEPLLTKEGIKGGAIYAEYRTDDARLTIEIAKTAAVNGAVLINYVKAIDFIYNSQKIAGIVAEDQLKSFRFNIRSKVVVNAAGPWVDELRLINKSRSGKKLHLTKGVHIVIPWEKLPVRQAIYFNVDDGRMIFAIPRARITYIGTTDTNYTGNIDQVATSKADAEYLINAVNKTFRSADLQLTDVESSWAGLRPLIHEEGKTASELSRKDEIFESPSQLISIAGGKLTGYRKMAERVVDLVLEEHFPNAHLDPCRTQEIKLTSPSFADYDEVRVYIREIASSIRSLGLDESTAAYLVNTYGRASEKIIEMTAGKASRSYPLAMAELEFCLQNEMVQLPSDFLIRRTGLLYFNLSGFQKIMTDVLARFSSLHEWDAQEYARQKSALEQLMKEATMSG